MRLLDNITAKNILVVGDVMLDTYFFGDVKRISPEAPVPVFRKCSERSVLGGAANVASNLVAAGQNVSIMTVIGKDRNGEKLKAIFQEQGINVDLVKALERNTTEKTRFLGGNNQQMFRLDIEDIVPINREDGQTMLAELENSINEYDLILVSDYLKGLLTYEFTQGIVQMARQRNIPVVIDVKDPKIDKYKKAYLLKPNLKELCDLTGRVVSDDHDIIEASEYVKEMCECNYILTTCGAKGMVLVGEDAPYFIESAGHEVFDVTGAGDTAIAYLSACMANGISMKDSVNIANSAAGIQVSKVGTSCVFWHEIREYMSSLTEGAVHKLISGMSVEGFRRNNLGKRIVFTNGCFDILHIGHIRYLQEAAKLGDKLVVGINSDQSVRRLKGDKRPINSELERAEMICALEFVDYVVIFEEDTPLELIKKIKPNILVKGGDYSDTYVIGTNEVKANGGKLVVLPFVEGKSTTNIIKRIQH